MKQPELVRNTEFKAVKSTQRTMLLRSAIYFINLDSIAFGSHIKIATCNEFFLEIVHDIFYNGVMLCAVKNDMGHILLHGIS